MPNKVYIAGRNQTKTVTPSNIQQTIEPDSGYNALDAVVVNPIKAAMPQTLEQFIMRDQNMEPFSLNLDGAVPDYACYKQDKLVAVYGVLTSVGKYSFFNCSSLQNVNLKNCSIINDYGFQGCLSLQEVDLHIASYVGIYGFANCVNLRIADCRNLDDVKVASFQNCENLEAVDCRNVTCFNLQGFRYCTKLKLVDLTNSHSAVLANPTNALPDDANNLIVLVADATDKAYYQSATNWSTFASKIKTIAEFEQEIGMSYDNYYLQVFGHPRNEVQS